MLYEPHRGTYNIYNSDEVIRVNLRGAFLVTKHALRGMIRRRYGRLIYISSLAAVVGSSGQGSYAAGKAGLHAMAHPLAESASPRGPGSVEVLPSRRGACPG